jgi:beta-galactosidase
MNASNRQKMNCFRISLLLFQPLFLMIGFAEVRAQQYHFLDQVYKYIEDPAVFELNQEPGHFPLIPYANAREALSGSREKSGNYISLNGLWKFYYAETPEGAPHDFFLENYNDKNWSDIRVPGNWEMQGFGDPLFRNVTTPFHPDPPRIPHEYNPTGSYRKTFTLPAHWKGKQVFLRMEKTASASFVWVNGREVGYNEGSQEPAEYNITGYLKQGKNSLAVHVIKYSDGYYLEDQDYWRLAGIFDNVWLYATPGVHLRDWQAVTDLDDEYRDARLSCTVEVANYNNTSPEGYSLKATLYEGQKAIQVLTSEKFRAGAHSVSKIKLSETVENPAKWSAEIPNLYTLVIELIQEGGKTMEAISGRIGFKETEIRHQVFYLNGAPVKLNGINSHMQHPDLGHAMDEATMRKDFTLMKQFNINCVRTSHYPPVIRYLELADEYGIYVVDETGDESHATEFVSDLKEWEPMYLERVRKMVLRDRNHPCILFWSAGNESGEGKNICAVIAGGKELDPTRFWMYGGNAFSHPCEEIIGPRYPTPFEWITEVGMIPESQDPRPSFMDEYLSVAGNGGGALDEYWEVIRNYPRSMGGAIWDFVSPGLREKVVALTDASPNQVQVNIMGRAKLVVGKSGKAIDLNGHDQWVEIYRDQATEIDGNGLTLSMWIYPRSLNSSAGTLITKGSYQFGLRQIGHDSIEFYLTTGRRQQVREALPRDWENRWHHLAAVYDGVNISIAIDGHPGRKLAVSGNIRNLPYPVNIGRNAEIHGQETSDYLCDALIDQAGIFSIPVDPASLMGPSDELKRKAALWLDFEESSETGEFFSNGIGARTYGSIWPDRRPQPEMWQIKKSAQPVSVKLLDAEEGLVEITNRFLFTGLNTLETFWSLEADGEVISSGQLSADLMPSGKSIFRIPYRKPELKEGAEYYLVVSFRQKKDLPWAEKGFETAWEQFKLPWFRSVSTLTEMPGIEPEILDSTDHLVVRGKSYHYIFDKKTGHLVSMRYNGKELIHEGPELNVWRAPLANELDAWGSNSSGATHWGEGFGQMAATDWYSTGLDNPHRVLESFSYAAQGSRIIVEVKEIITLTRQSNGFQNHMRYTLCGNGEIMLENTIIPCGDMPAWFPRIGNTWILDKSLDQVQWYGRGPQENYPDRKSGYRIGQYRSNVYDMREPYLIPQDYGLRTENRWVRMTDQHGTGLAFSGNALFNFNAFPYTTGNLTKSCYTYQLKSSDGITFNFDYATSGVGCTARSVFNQYRVMPMQYDFTLRVKPVGNMQ